MMEHSIVLGDVDTTAGVQPTRSTMVYNYKTLDSQAMREDMKNFSLPEGNMQQQYDSFEDKLHQMIDSHMPS